MQVNNSIIVAEILVDIDDDLKKIALEHSENRLQYEFNRFGLSDNEKRKSMILIGTVGQLILKKYLEDNNIKFESEFQAGEYDKKDFEINEKIIEVKCSGYDDKYQHLNLLYAKDQFHSGIKKGFVYCIQIFINGYNRSTQMIDITKCNKGIIFGYIEFEKIINFKNNHRKSYKDELKVPLSELKAISELLEIVK